MKVPMRTKNLEITDPNEREQILKSGQIITVAMSHGDQPYVLPFNYGFLNGLIYIHSARKGFKLKGAGQEPQGLFQRHQRHSASACRSSPGLLGGLFQRGRFRPGPYGRRSC